MKVLMLGWEFPPLLSGGLGTACQGLTEGLAQQGVEVLLVLPRLSGREHLALGSLQSASDLAPSVTLRSIDTPLRPYLSGAGYAAGTGSQRTGALSGGYGPDLFSEVTRYAQAAAEIAAREDFDVIHAHDWMTVSAGLAAREQSGKPLCWHVHATEHDRNRAAPDARIEALERQGLEQADAVICVSHYTAQLLHTRYGAPEERMRVVHNGVRAPRGRRPLVRKPFAEPLALFLGRVTAQKGPAQFLEAAARVVAREPKVKFALAGGGELLPELIEQAASLGLARHMHFTGALPPREVARMYAMADLFVMPSISEPFGIAPLEAMLQGKPVILSRQSGVSEVLESAIKVDGWDTQAWADAMWALMSDAPLREYLGQRARVEARRLRWGTAGAKVADLYQELSG